MEANIPNDEAISISSKLMFFPRAISEPINGNILRGITNLKQKY